jgi:hypothetical protein
MGPSFSKLLQGISKPFQGKTKIFQGNSKLFQTFSLGVSFEINGLAAKAADFAFSRMVGPIR